MPNNLPPNYQPFYFNQQVFSVRLASQSNLAGNLAPQNNSNGVGTTLTNSGALAALVIDGSSVVVGDRVALIGQTSANQNGIYVVNDPGSSVAPWILTRAPDFCTLEQLSAGQHFSIEDGSAFKGGQITLVRPLPGSINVDPMSFVIIG